MADGRARIRGETASLVTDALQKSGKLEKFELIKCIDQVSKKAEEVKSQVYETIYQKYTEFFLVNDSTSDLLQKVKTLTTDINSVNQKIESEVKPQLGNATSEHSKLTRELNTSNAIIILLEKLLKVDDNFSTLTSDILNGQYFQAAHVLGQVKKQLEEFSQDAESKVFKPLWSEYSSQKSILINHLEKAWSTAVTWTPSDVPSVDSLEGQLKTSLSLGHAELKNIQSIVGAMQALGILDKRLKIFEVNPVFVTTTGAFPKPTNYQRFHKKTAILRLSKDPQRSKKIEPGKLYSKLLDVIGFVHSELFKSDELAADNSKTPDIGALFGTLGKLVWPVFSDQILIKEYLANTVPSTSSDLEKYKEVIEETSVFEQQLVALGFIPESETKLTSYAKDINVHFANKKCQDLLASARDLMKSEIHNMVVVTPDNDKAVTFILEQGNVDDKKSSKAQIQKHLSEMTFHLPQCKISESVQKIVEMSYEILQEATVSSPECAIQLFYTARNIFELFCHVVPTYHQNSLSTLPQLAALHHNNCMYIAHHLQTLGVQFRPSLPPPLNQGTTASFIDLTPTIRSLGENCFLEQMRRQRDQLLEIIRSVGGFANAGEDEKVEEIERAIKQIVYLLVHLSKVWFDVLPVNIYHKTLGALINVVLEEFIIRVLELEDISAVEGPQLHSLLSMLADKLPEVFQRDGSAAKDISVIVESWNRYKELIGVLDSSLQNFVDRWADGKGPLAHLFTSNEVRGLIRALFQNSDIRAAALGKIKS